MLGNNIKEWTWMNLKVDLVQLKIGLVGKGYCLVVYEASKDCKERIDKTTLKCFRMPYFTTHTKQL